MDLTVSTDHRENEKKNEYMDLARELKKTMQHEGHGDTNCNCSSWYSHQRTGTRTGGLGNKRTSKDHPKFGVIKIGKDTEKSPGNLRWLEETFCLSDRSEKPSANGGMKNSNRSKQ